MAFLHYVGLSLSFVSTSWEVVCETPEGHTPQGMAAVGGELFLSVYRGREEGSAVFRLDMHARRPTFTNAFEMPPEARHTSGLVAVPGRDDRLIAVDYRSHLVYLLDLPRSVATGKARVLATAPSGMKGTSACGVVRLANGQHVLIVSEFRLLGCGVNKVFDLHPGSSDTGTRGAIQPFVQPHKWFPPFDNWGYAQGMKFQNGFVYETGNRPLGPSYVLAYRVEDALSAGRIPANRGTVGVPGPAHMIEDLELWEGYVWTTDEGTCRLYRMPLSSFLLRAAPQVR